jgi:hypothetical protein
VLEATKTATGGVASARLALRIRAEAALIIKKKAASIATAVHPAPAFKYGLLKKEPEAVGTSGGGGVILLGAVGGGVCRMEAVTLSAMETLESVRGDADFATPTGRGIVTG